MAALDPARGWEGLLRMSLGEQSTWGLRFKCLSGELRTQFTAHQCLFGIVNLKMKGLSK